jgi:hypothetical protein
VSLVDEVTGQDILRAINFNWDRDKDRSLSESQFPVGNRVALMSPPNDGKTTTVAGMFSRANAKVGDTLHHKRRFLCRMLERGSTIHQDVSDLSNGIFPAKTQTYLGFKSSPGLLLEDYLNVDVPVAGGIMKALGRKPRLYHRALQVSINDLPGETISQVMWQYRMKAGTPQQKVLADAIGNAVTEMRNCQAYIFILNCALAHGLGLPIEYERDPNVSRDPDVNAVRMLEDIASYKSRHNQQINAIYVVLAQWDKLEPRAKELDFDLFDPNLAQRQKDLEEFVRHCFPQFFGMLHSCGAKLVNYYPTFFQTVKEKDSVTGELREKMFTDSVAYYVDGQLHYKQVERPHIMTKDPKDLEARMQYGKWANVRQISASWETFDKLLNDIMELAVKV